MTDTPSFSDLEAFAREQLRADRYPGDAHPFTVFRCPSCGVVPFELIVEHHTGSRADNFRGRVFGTCARCGEPALLFNFTGGHRRPLREERPVCSCKGDRFFVAECERVEGPGGLTGFFDEGVIVGRCASCGRNVALLYTD